MKTVLALNTNRSGYSPSQIGHTMTVKQMIQKLENYPEDMSVMFSNDNGYTYGEITKWDFDIIEDVEDDEDEDEDGLE